MIRWGAALFALGLVWPLQPAWAFWLGTVLSIAGAGMLGHALGRHLRDREPR